MKKIIIILNGRNVAFIARDAREIYPNHDYVVVRGDKDPLPTPEGMESIPLSEFSPTPGEEYIFVANGGRSSEQVRTLLRLERSGATYVALDLQPDYVQELARGPIMAYRIVDRSSHDGVGELVEASYATKKGAEKALKDENRFPPGRHRRYFDIVAGPAYPGEKLL